METPYYIIDKNELDSNFNKLNKALSDNWNNYIIGYSYKTNSLPWIIDYFHKKNCFAEVVSEDEYELAKFVGVNLSKIIYNGPIKTKNSFIEAIKNGCIVNIDSKREIMWLDDLANTNCSVGIRVNFDIEKMCPGQSQCLDEGGRFGFCYENGDLKNAINSIISKGIRINCLHLHVSSRTRSLDIYDSISKMACKLKKEFNLDLEFIDIGGGFFGGLPTKPQFDEYFSLIAKNLKFEFSPNRTTLIIEPGMSVIGSCIDYVSRVIDIKDTTYNRFVVTDGTRTSIDPLMTKKTYFYDIICGAKKNNLSKQIICGYTCMEHDRLFVLEDYSELNIGDIIIYHKVGAYTMCLTPLFIRYFPDVYVRENDRVLKVREKWTPIEYVQKSRGF